MIKSGEKSLHGSGIDKITQQFYDPNGVGILSPARYEIMIAAVGSAPTTMAHGKHASLNSGNIEAMKRLSNSCESASFASRTIASNPNRIHGPVREMPYESVYGGDLDLTFRVGQDMFERKYWEFWMDTIIDHANNNVGYYDDYNRDIFIAQLGPDDSIVYKMVYRECYPKTVNAIDLGFEKTDDYIRQSVSIAYREFEVLSTHLIGDDLAFRSMGEDTLNNVNAKRELLEKESTARRTAAQRGLTDEVMGSIKDEKGKIKSPDFGIFGTRQNKPASNPNLQIPPITFDTTLGF